jgi:parvulin-like peptidyl-prolyl isomerase
MNFLCIIPILYLSLGEIPAVSAGKPSQKPASDETVAATVGGEPVFVRDVERFVEKAARGKKLAPEGKSFLQARALEEIINRRLVMDYAERSGENAKPAEIDKALAGLKTQLAQEGKTIDEYLKTRAMSEAELRHQLAWNAVWEKYSAKYATPERLQKYFDAHRPDYDGTEIVVSHILLASSQDEKDKSEAVLLERAKSIRQKILDGHLSFPEAAKLHSTGPSSADGGKLGPIGRHGPMEESFSRAAFALEIGMISPPVITHFGVHLIYCDEIRPGDKTLADVEPELREALDRELLETLAKRQRAKTPVIYSEHSPASPSETGQSPSSEAQSER